MVIYDPLNAALSAFANSRLCPPVSPNTVRADCVNDHVLLFDILMLCVAATRYMRAGICRQLDRSGLAYVLSHIYDTKPATQRLCYKTAPFSLTV